MGSITAADAAPQLIALTCRACGKSWQVARLGLNESPRKGARCPKDDGGCGLFHFIAKSPAAPPPARTEAQSWPEVWQPKPITPLPLRAVKGPDGATVADDACGEPLAWEPSGTLQICTNPSCRARDEPVFPPELMPRERPGDLRRAATRDEVLDQALALAGQKAQLLARIDECLNDSRTHPETRGHLGIFRAQIQDAADVGALRWLAERLRALPVRELPSRLQPVAEAEPDDLADGRGRVSLLGLAQQMRDGLALPAGEFTAARPPTAIVPTTVYCRQCGTARDPAHAGCPCGRADWIEWGRPQIIVGSA